ncbi:hypothetical protein PV325_008961 [Microctonus aethiopoides]|uniref:Cilia- and flagella-associated protein 97 n=1 Tax=Microctonus aethiopoides TaxID=144406 RepID=A0AA39C768_9HYME|nr:hypothetical protein PV325_008961 [Microctonus aethiopoides]KAK0097755.1 hypothetical protein PV326_013969 [Microctonus aethiopoides]KAK0159078.1 hypothetical protein PV328_010005 [Microctonus aethiopoides]
MTDHTRQLNVKVNIDDENVSSEANYESDSDEYSYSEESLCSNNFSRESEITNVTRRSSINSTTSVMSSSSFNSKMSSTINKSLTNSERSLNKNLNGNHKNGSCSSLNDISSGQRGYRRNMSFTNIEMMRIERENQYLLRKIMAQQQPPKITQIKYTPTKMSSSAINRKRLQKRIEEENMMMLRRIQGAKSCVFADKTVPGYRLTCL